MNVRGKDIKVFAGNSNLPLAQGIAEKLGIPLGKCKVGRFSDGEISVSIEESVRGMDCFIIQSTSDPVNDNLMELLIMADALRRASATRITAVIPYFGYARQDRKAHSRDPISAKLVADMIMAAGIDRVLTMDLHAQQIQGFFKIPVDHLVGWPVLANYLYPRVAANLSDYVCLSPDMGSVSRVRNFAHEIGNCAMAIVDKRRPEANRCEVMNLIGDVSGKHVILIDDMIDTAGTIKNAAEAAIERGALSVCAACSHAVFSGPAIERLEAAPIDELVTLDTINMPEEKKLGKITILSTASYFADSIRSVHDDESMTDVIEDIFNPERFSQR